MTGATRSPRRDGRRRALVIGAGTVGVTTAHELLDTGFEVTLVADLFGSATPGALAAPAWDWPAPPPPGIVTGRDGGPDLRVEQWSVQTYRRLMRDAARPGSGVDPRRTHVRVDPAAARDRSERRRTTRIQATATGFAWHPAGPVPPTPVASYCFLGPVVDIARYLRHLTTDLVERGAHVRRRFVTDARAALGLAAEVGADVLVNCTGGAAGSLVDDAELWSARRVRVSLPNGSGRALADRRCAVLRDPGGAIVRLSACPVGDRIVFDATGAVAPDRAVALDAEALVLRCADHLGLDMDWRRPELLVGTTSQRRTGGRVELDDYAAMPVVHNYGHGVGALGVLWGAAASAAALAAASVPARTRAVDGGAEPVLAAGRYLP